MSEPRIKIIYGCDFSEWISARVPRLAHKLKGPCIGYGDAERLLAAVVFTNYTGRSLECTLAAESPAWCSRRALRAIFAYVFDTCSCVRFTVMVASDNERSVSLIERLGFKREGSLRNFYDDGADLMIYGMLKSEAINAGWFIHG